MSQLLAPVQTFVLLSLLVSGLWSCSLVPDYIPESRLDNPNDPHNIVPTVFSLAGSGTESSDDGTGINASFASLSGIGGGPSGEFYVLECLNGTIRKVSTKGEVVTWAGTGVPGFSNLDRRQSAFSNPLGIAVDPSGTIFVADQANHVIRRISTAGRVTTWAGSGTPGSLDGSQATARFFYPSGVAATPSGIVYVADTGNHLIRRVSTSGAVTTVAGTGSPGSLDGQGRQASFRSPMGIVVDSAGTLYVADTGNHRIRKITSAGAVTTVAGSGAIGSTNGVGVAASFSSPTGVAIDGAGTIYVADYGNHSIRRISVNGMVTTFAGTGVAGLSNGPAEQATFHFPYGVAVGTENTIYVTDSGNNVVRKIIQP